MCISWVHFGHFARDAILGSNFVFIVLRCLVSYIEILFIFRFEFNLELHVLPVFAKSIENSILPKCQLKPCYIHMMIMTCEVVFIFFFSWSFKLCCTHLKGVLHLWALFLKTLCIFSKNKATSDKVSYGSGQKCSKELKNLSFTSVETIVVKLQWKMCENQYFPCFEP